ncbi:hypothetical protein GCM10023322_28930 [Rugosimonospora acidiphila]|uniref:Tetratricopeptide repeat protein n=1 Tax=Rugosimonospora acidiphila TaxID=556531 RepID=A0ABP9RR61_9ACTN
MAALTLSRVTYLAGHPGRTDPVPGLTLVLDRRGIAVRGRLRRFLAFAWKDLRGLEIRQSSTTWFLLPGPALEHVDAIGASLLLTTDKGLSRLHVNGVGTKDLRTMFSEWVVREAGPSKPSPAMPPAPTRKVAGQLGVAQMSVELWRANSLGREPLYERGTLAYRMGVAENHRRIGHFAEAIALLEPLVERATETFGPDDRGTLTVRNALGQTYLDAGEVDDGLGVLREVLATAEHLHGEDNDLTLVFRNNLAAGYQQAGQYPQAIELHERNIEYSERRHGPADLGTIGRRNNFASTLGFAGQRERSIDQYWAVLDALAGTPHRLADTARQNLAILHNPSWRP